MSPASPLIQGWTKGHRLTRRAEFLACYDNGEKHHTRYFIIHARPGWARARLGLTVSRKCGNAVERNRIKRVLREYFRLNQATMPVMDMVISPKRSLQADQINLHLVTDDLSPLLKRLADRHPVSAETSVANSAPSSPGPNPGKDRE